MQYRLKLIIRQFAVDLLSVLMLAAELAIKMFLFVSITIVLLSPIWVLVGIFILATSAANQK